MTSAASPSPSEWSDFIALVDPERALAKSTTPNNLPKLLALAHIHGLLPIALRKLAENSELINVIRDDKQLTTYITNNELTTGLTMMLDHFQQEIKNALREKGLRSVIVKGPIFSQTIYKNFIDRPFTDIDLLTHPEDIEAVGDILTKAGFARFKKTRWDRSDIYQEQKWFLSGNQNIMVELHGNLVHYPSLRRHVSFGYKDYIKACKTGIDCPIALFMTAVVHASLGHKFHKLQLLVDVLQAFRHLSDEHISVLPEVSKSLSLRLETALCLNLINTVFSEKHAGDVAQCISLPLQSSLARALVSGSAVLKTHGPSRIQRHAFRCLQMMHFGR